MSSPLTPQAPRPDSLTATPEFKIGGLLPKTSEQVLRNYRVQQQAYDPFETQAIFAARAAGHVYSGAPCMKILTLTLCFDGTNNHEPTDKLANPSTTTNVARLYHASVGATDNETAQRLGYYAYYIPGVGTEFKEIGEFKPDDQGLTMAVGGENRINWGLTRLIDALRRACGEEPLPSEEAYALVQQMGTSLTADMLGASLFKNGHARRKQALHAPLKQLQATIAACHAAKSIAEIKALRLFVYGFSRGAAEARAFASWLEALTQVEVEGEICYLFAGLPIKIVFMGLFDTVASVGLAYLAPFAAGHMGWADGSLRLSDSEKFLEHCVHLVAAHEQRGCFPLDSIRRKANPNDPLCPSTYRNGTVEYIYPGVHSDVGGGYPPGEQGKAFVGGQEVLSQIALHHMYDEAYRVGAPLQAPMGDIDLNLQKRWPWLMMDEKTRNEFDVGPTLIKRFNSWCLAMDNGPLEEVMAREAGLITGWRINRYANYFLRDTEAYRQVTKNGQPHGPDMNGSEVMAFTRLHALQLEQDAAARAGQGLPELSEKQLAQQQEDEQTKRGYEQRTGATTPLTLNTSKVFEPNLDYRQLNHAMNEFRRDYIPEWSLSEGYGLTTGNLTNTLFGGLVYMTNSEDEAKEYAQLRATGNRNYAQLFDDNGRTLNKESVLDIVKLFDEQVHDSRAWFMNSTLNEREPFTDYFRYRCIFFDSESNKPLSPLIAAGQVIGVALSVASLGLTIKRRDPRYLVGLIIPSLGIPAFRGKVGFPEISAFDNLTGIALPMLEGLEDIRAFTKDTGNVLKLVNALPLPPALSEQTATTDDLKAVLKAAEALKAVTGAAQTALGEGSLADGTPGAAPPGWLDQAKGALRDMT